MSKKFRIFAGPNGSGKSTLIHEVRKDYHVGFFVNADEIEKQINESRFLDVSNYCDGDLTQKDWDTFLHKFLEKDVRFDDIFPKIILKDKFLVCKELINSYHASVIAEFFRNILLDQEQTFSFETVMSHKSKLEFLKKAKEAGFTIYLYFICTQDPKINLQRVVNRVEKGGHNVDQKKIVNRYFRSLDLLFDAFLIADRAFIIDSSNKSREVILEKNKNQILLHNQNVPEWVGQYLLDKIENKNL